MARFFTLDQAQALIPEVEPAIRKAIFLKNEFQQAGEELRTAMHRISLMGGCVIDRERLSAQRTRRDSSGAQLKETVGQIHAYGCTIKDIDIGLIDFPTLYRGEEVCLCWKLGETGIEYWHGPDEGFRGRKKIDRDFLDNHRGGITH